MKVTFPEVRALSRSRGVDFIVVDLRWGITKEEAENGEVIRICLEEINRCKPYFIGILGERYGWTPNLASIPHYSELAQQFPMINQSLENGLSITEMEIVHGVLNNKDEVDAFFYERDKKLTQYLEEHDHNINYVEDEEEKLTKLQCLKSRIKSATNTSYATYQSIEGLGSQIKEDLLSLLDQKFPQVEKESALAFERSVHQSYAAEQCLHYYPNPLVIRELDRYVSERTEALNKTPFVVFGESGLGKSALLSYWSRQFRQSSPNHFVIEYFPGAKGAGSERAVMIRVIEEIRDRLTDPIQSQHEIKALVNLGLNELAEQLKVELSRITDNNPLIIVIDAINQITMQGLAWLPKTFPRAVSVILSVVPGQLLEQMRMRNWCLYELPCLDRESRRVLTEEYLGLYRKRLSPLQIEKIVSHPRTSNPLFLTIVLSELNLFGRFEDLDRLIDECLSHENIKSLYTQLIKRIELDYDSLATKDVLKMIWASLNGMSERELTDALNLSPLSLSKITLALDAHLLNRDGLLSFTHAYLSDAVQGLYLSSTEEQNDQHIKLANYFELKKSEHDLNVPLDYRIVDELPWQYRCSSSWDNLYQVLTDVPFFSVAAHDEYNLLLYWVRLGEDFDIESAYLTMLENQGVFIESEVNSLIELADSNINVHEYKLTKENYLEKVKLAELVYSVLSTSGRTLHLRPFTEWFTGVAKVVYGENSPELVVAKIDRASLLYRLGDYEDAEKEFLTSIALLNNEHLDSTSTQGEEFPIGLYNLSNQYGQMLMQLGRYEEAEDYLRTSLRTAEDFYDPQAPAVLLAKNNIALLLQSTGDYVTAEKYFRDNLNHYQQTFGTYAPDTLTTKMNLGFVLQQMGEAEAARNELETCMHDQSLILGADHPSTLICSNNLGLTLIDLGELEAAKEVFLFTLEGQIARLGEKHPSTYLALNNLGFCFYLLNDLLQAKPLLYKAYEGQKEVLGFSHLDTLATYNNIALLHDANNDHEISKEILSKIVNATQDHIRFISPKTLQFFLNLAASYKSRGEVAQAVELYSQIVEHHINYYGDQHPETWVAMTSFASALSSNEEYDRAYNTFTRVIELQVKRFGKKHDSTLSSQCGLAYFYRYKGDYEKAKSILEEVYQAYYEKYGTNHHLSITLQEEVASTLLLAGEVTKASKIYEHLNEVVQETFDPDHPKVLDMKENIAELHLSQGYYDQALTVFRELYDTRRDVYGLGHPKTENTGTILANIYYKLGFFDESIELNKLNLESKMERLGESHSSTILSLNNIGLNYHEKGDQSSAMEVFRKALMLQIERTGERHPQTLIITGNLALAYISAGEYEKAIELYQDLLTLQQEVFGLHHPSTLLTQNNFGLAMTYYGMHAPAEKLLIDTAQKQEETLGEHHSDTLTTLNNLGLLMTMTNRLNEAKNLYMTIIGRQVEVLGEKHPSVLTSKGNLAQIISELGQYDEANQYFDELILLNNEVLGHRHPNAILTRYNSLLIKQVKKELCLDDVIELQVISEESLGDNHPTTLCVMLMHAEVLMDLNDQKNSKKILDMYHFVSKSRELIFNLDHFDTCDAIIHYAEVLLSFDEQDRFIALKERVLNYLRADDGYVDWLEMYIEVFNEIEKRSQ